MSLFPLTGRCHQTTELLTRCKREPFLAIFRSRLQHVPFRLTAMPCAGGSKALRIADTSYSFSNITVLCLVMTIPSTAMMVVTR